ncbi:uncharacterized protein LOC118323910 isoform X2 [Morone saxatilis]|uniref:uncharacterized protein LOC118323910 isoform X2 n=1 Tax=Morone saxatilis TaxID=34816 RepID=UPI0015E1D66A|nr:uncharacterized protein LOC118323910 isoform X2 [Morone saxatilis]
MDHEYSLPLAAKRKRTGDPAEQRRTWGRKRARTRVNIGAALRRWREVRDMLGLQKDSELACLLLDDYHKGEQASSTPSRIGGLPVQTLSTMSTSSDSQPDSDHSFLEPEDLSMADLKEEALDERIDCKGPDDDTWETASEDGCSDEDSIPSISLRYFPMAYKYGNGDGGPHSNTEYSSTIPENHPEVGLSTPRMSRRTAVTSLI